MGNMVGLVGGIGPEATIDYYRRLLAAWEQSSPGSAPALLIDHLDVQLVIRLAPTDVPSLADYVLGSVTRLAAAGATFGAITSNSTHLVFDDVATRSPIPLISIIETCADEALRRGFRRPLLLGARFTMDAAMYPNAFARRGLEIVIPDADDRAWIHDRYVNELVRGDFREATRNEFIAFVHRLKPRHDIDAVILGGTELPLLLREPTLADLPVLDTTGLHVAAIVQRLGSR